MFMMPKIAFAVNFYDGARAQGTYFLTYTSFYTADEMTNKNGNAAIKDFGFFNIQELIRLCYYSTILSPPLLSLWARRIFAP